MKTERGKKVCKNAKKRCHRTEKGKESLRNEWRCHDKKLKVVRIEGMGKHSIAACQNASAVDIGEQTSENPKCKSNLVSVLLHVWPFSASI